MSTLNPRHTMTPLVFLDSVSGSAKAARRFVAAGGLLASLACAATGLAASAAFAQAGVTAAPANTAKATFGGGCFWCVEADFDKVPGVLSTLSGYTGGSVPNPTYEQVSAKATGHVEVVQITFDTTQVSYEQLLATYWRSIDPTTKDRQFCDAGSPYRSAIFVHDKAQLDAAQKSLKALEAAKPFKEPIVTQIQLAGAFYAAEDYHQDYYLKNPVRYKYYRFSCGRDSRLEALWGKAKP